MLSKQAMKCQKRKNLKMKVARWFFCFDIISEVELKPEIIDAQQKEIFTISGKIQRHLWWLGHVFEDPNAEDDEYGDDGEFFDDEDVEDDNERLH